MNNKIVLIAGFSNTGKDTIANEIKNLGYDFIISHSTRPIRPGESQGNPYWFVSKDEMNKMIIHGELAEYRSYDTLVDGISDTWHYGVSKKSIEPNKQYVCVVDIIGVRQLTEIYGDRIIPIFIETSETLRFERAKSRGDFNITEWNRRLKDDNTLFTEEVISNEFKNIVENKNINEAISHIKEILKIDIIKDSFYYYDSNLSGFENMTYGYALIKKIKLATKLLHKLVRVENMEDTKRINDVKKAVDFNRNLLGEIGFDDKMIRQQLEEK